MNRFTLYAKQVATLGSVGYMPAPGTMATLCAALLLIPLKGLIHVFSITLWTEFWALCVVTLIGYLIIRQALKQLGWVHDPRQIVLDEVIGCWWSFWGVTLTFGSLVLGIVLFRVFDIAKPWLIGYAERIPGAWGVLLDDCCAGLATMLLLRIWY